MRKKCSFFIFIIFGFLGFEEGREEGGRRDG